VFIFIPSIVRAGKVIYSLRTDTNKTDRHMNAQQATWAMKHDWCRYVFEQEGHGDYTAVVQETGTQLQADGSTTEYSERKTFNDYQALRDWAGY
jgi:hypothetical protein